MRAHYTNPHIQITRIILYIHTRTYTDKFSWIQN